MSDSNCPTSETPVLLQYNRHVCITFDPHSHHCGHCDTGFICPVCKHNGMQTEGLDRKLPAHFALRCPTCGCKKSVYWIEYDLACPRCGRKDAMGTYSRVFERIIQCPDCGVSPRGEAA